MIAAVERARRIAQLTGIGRVYRLATGEFYATRSIMPGADLVHIFHRRTVT